MAYALVGSVGAASVGATSASVTPAWGAGSSQTTGNLLICWVTGIGAGSSPTTPADWFQAKSSTTTGLNVAILYKIAIGGDAAPTIAALSGQIWVVRLAEFSGNAAASPVDQQAVNASTTGTNTATAPSPDVASGELVIVSSGAHYTTATSVTNSNAINNGATTFDFERGGTSVNQYGHAWGVTTDNSGEDSNIFTYTTTNIQHAMTIFVSFLSGSESFTKSVTETLVAAESVARAGVFARTVAGPPY